MKLNILFIVFKFFLKSEHDFDLKNPIMDEITSTFEYKLSGTKIEKKWTVTGFRCKKCGEIVWFKKGQIKQLPKSIKYSCNY